MEKPHVPSEHSGDESTEDFSISNEINADGTSMICEKDNLGKQPSTFKKKRTRKDKDLEVITNRIKMQYRTLDENIEPPVNYMRETCRNVKSNDVNPSAAPVQDIFQRNPTENKERVSEIMNVNEEEELFKLYFGDQEIVSNKSEDPLTLNLEKNGLESIPNFNEAKKNIPTSGIQNEYSDILMFPQSNLHVNEVFEMLLGYFIEFNLVEKSRLKLIEIIKILAGPCFKNLNASNYLINKTLNPPEEVITFHYYCAQCKKEVIHSSVKTQIKDDEKVCSNCKTKNKISLGSSNYFLTLNFEYQLKVLLQNEKVRNSLFEKFVSRKTDKKKNGTICDIDDSELYRETQARFPKTLTYNLSTDGAPVTSGNSSTRGFWPISVVLNDLPPNMRFKHIFLGGIMIVTKEPEPHFLNLFIEKFLEQAIGMHKKGITITFVKDGIERRITFTLLCVIADSPAKALLQLRVQYNGYESCPYCYMKGFFVNSVKFPFLQCECEKRTHESHMKDVSEAEKIGNTFRGVKGRSSFCKAKNVDMVRSFPIDGMHNGILGVTDQFWELLRTKMTRALREKMDTMLLEIKPPHEVHRVPCKLSKKRCWKATNWKAFMLYYSVPLYYEVLPSEVVEHYALFVNSMFTLSKTNIDKMDLLKCETDLSKFVAYLDLNYGEAAMTFNVHLLLHAVENVVASGPLWATSAFPFENFIFILKQHVNGPKGAEQQMANKSVQRLLYQSKESRKNMPAVVRDFCDSCLSEKRFTPSSKSSGNVHFFSPYASDKCPPNCESFLRCISNGVIFTSVKYVQNQSFNDSIILLKDGTIAQIVDIFLRDDGSCLLNVNRIKVEPFQIGNEKMEHIFKVIDSLSEIQTVTNDHIQSKMVLINVDRKKYICVIPNCYEVQ